MRTMALDVGDKRIGVAVTDPGGLIAQGLKVIERIGIRKDCGEVMQLVSELHVGCIVIGLPLKLNGEDSIQTEKVRAFKKMLRNKMNSCKMSKIPIVYQDERLTTVEAERVLIEADVRRDKRREVIDKQAAVLILKAYIEKN